MLLWIKHDRCYLANKRNDNISLHLNIDGNYEDFKTMHFAAKGKLMKNEVDTRTTTIEISRLTMKDKDTLNTWKNMLRRVRAKCNSMKNEKNKEDENDNKEENGTIDACNDEVILGKYHKTERSYEPCLDLSTRRKKIRVSKVNR